MGDVKYYVVRKEETPFGATIEDVSDRAVVTLKDKAEEDSKWIFTFGYGQKFAGKYVLVIGTYESARQKMIDHYGLEWAFQYSEEQWNDWMNRKPDYIPAETLLEVLS